MSFQGAFKVSLLVLQFIYWVWAVRSQGLLTYLRDCWEIGFIPLPLAKTPSEKSLKRGGRVGGGWPFYVQKDTFACFWRNNRGFFQERLGKTGVYESCPKPQQPMNL